MCDLNCVNLIDLSLEDDIPCNNNKVKTDGVPSKKVPFFIPSTWCKRDSLENNPFDCVQNLADRLDDPFDIVEKEACQKALQNLKALDEVKLGNLLSLGEDTLLDDHMPVTPSLATEECSAKQCNELELESPPILYSSAESSTSTKLNKNMQHQKRLLKLSISNSSFNSPLAGKESLEFENVLGTPVSSMLCRAAEFGENLLAAESPLKLVEDEDLMSEEPPNFLDSDFEADLEMLKIPMLNELLSPPAEQITTKLPENSDKVEINTSANLENALPSIQEIREKLKNKKKEINYNHQQEISSLIQNLKILISSDEVIEKSKKQASDLLESLSLALKPINIEHTLKPTAVEPQPIKREGTFDIDLQEKEVTNQPLGQEMPNCMVSSSATYDGDTHDEIRHLNLPEIAPLSPQTSSFTSTHEYNKKDENKSGINDIMRQLSKIILDNTADNPSNSNNPTLIVVMNANQFNQSNIDISNQNAVAAKKKSAIVANYLENSINNGSPDLTKIKHMPRRRSHSLSIHDKLKVFQLPLQQPIPCLNQKQQDSVQMDELSSITKTPPSVDNEMLEFKTPARMVRRNSYSSGTPFTVQVGVRRTGFRPEIKNPTVIRRTQTLVTHHEGQQQVVERPMSMPPNNLPLFKPDLKKKSKHNTESVIKSSGPLKATIPVKKVAPTLKTSSPSPESNTRSSTLHNMTLQNQLKISRVPTTPLIEKGSSTSSVGVGYPSACSTPASFTSSPIKRTIGSVNKQRYSYIPSTPNSKSFITNSAKSISLKRRTITEFKSKSPVKSRVCNTGLAETVATTSNKNSRLLTTAGARIAKTPVKTATASTATVKLTNRINSRVSVSGSVLSARNKENKRP